MKTFTAIIRIEATAASGRSDVKECCHLRRDSADSVIEDECVSGFAGSQYSDERRRRRLAVEQDAWLSQHGNRDDDCERRADDVELVQLPIADLVPRAAWAHCAIALTLAVVIFGGRYVSALVPPHFGLDRAEITRVADNAHHLAGGLCLLAATQLCWAIRLIRGRSRGDFSGRYRLWNWIIAAGLAMTAAALINWHELTARVVAASLQRPDLASAPMMWKIPTLILGGLLFLALKREMRDDRWAITALFAAMFAYLVPLVSGIRLLSTVPAIPLPAVLELPVEALAAMAGHILLLASMSLHLRYVAHINPEPPTSPLKQFRIPLRLILPKLRLRKLRLPKLRLPRLRLPVLSLKRPRLPKLPRIRLPKLRRDKVRAESLPPADLDTKTAQTEPPKTTVQDDPPKPVPQKPAAKAKTPKRKKRVEPAHDSPPAPQAETLDAAADEMLDDLSPDELKGLTKKQKRMLRKQRREAQRAARG